MSSWRFRLLLALGWAAILADGSGLQVLPLLSTRASGLEAGSTSEKIAGLRDRAYAAVTKAYSSQSVAKSSALTAQQVQLEAMTTAQELKDFAQQATLQADSAADAVKEADNSVKSMKANKQDTIKLARQLAVDKVRELFLDKYKALDGWRKDVLKDTHAKAALEGPKAAEPYSRALDVYYNRIQAYQAQARSVARQSNQAVAEAGRLSDAAQEKVQVGDTIGANQDLELARSMQAQGAAYAENAKSLQASANEMNLRVGLYYSAGQAASERAAFQADPNRMPVMQVDPNLAYAPPPQR